MQVSQRIVNCTNLRQKHSPKNRRSRADDLGVRLTDQMEREDFESPALTSGPVRIHGDGGVEGQRMNPIFQI